MYTYEDTGEIWDSTKLKENHMKILYTTEICGKEGKII